jgi:peptide deformylase
MSTHPTRLRIRCYGEPILRKRAKPLRLVTEAEKAVFEEMAEVMRFSGGIGLAAPQVGISKQMVVVDIGQGPVMLVNPRIIKKTGSVPLEEGCLSLPGIYVKVRRAKKITVTGLNEKNEKVSLAAQDLFARALQHEIDHLRGRLIIDYANFIQKIQLKKRLKNLKNGGFVGLPQ